MTGNIDNDGVFLFSEQNVLLAKDTFSFRKYLKNSDTWYIVDGSHPKRYNAKTILICSPQKCHYLNFDKWANKTVWYMPVWNYEEIKTCKDKIFKDLEEEKIKGLFLKW